MRPQEWGRAAEGCPQSHARHGATRDSHQRFVGAAQCHSTCLQQAGPHPQYYKNRTGSVSKEKMAREVGGSSGQGQTCSGIEASWVEVPSDPRIYLLSKGAMYLRRVWGQEYEHQETLLSR